ncbi:ribosome maturation factor RimP [Gordonia caeni]|uniref:Ribosome maturation factor RimP n=1 Tax=Gordonia caeni TaxID=1007097 RepID=A0ABP7P4X9_9ACTN
MTDTTHEQIGDLAAPIIGPLGYDVEEIAVRGPAGRRDVTITVDRDGGASLDELADVSRRLSDVLDEADLFGDEPYHLEVSTPGIDRPLTLPRHWRRARGRKVSLERAHGGGTQTALGRIGDSDDESVTLVNNDKGRMSTTTVPLAEITRAVLEVDFTRPGEAELRRCGLDEDEIARRRTPAP